MKTVLKSFAGKHMSVSSIKSLEKKEQYIIENFADFLVSISSKGPLFQAFSLRNKEYDETKDLY